MSEGGGTILDEQGRVTVTNPHTIRAWDRAARWVGSISPPGVVAYKEWDAFNIWQEGKAAFMRNWTSGYTASRAPNSPTKDRFDIAPLPARRGRYSRNHWRKWLWCFTPFASPSASYDVGPLSLRSGRAT